MASNRPKNKSIPNCVGSERRDQRLFVNERVEGEANAIAEVASTTRDEAEEKAYRERRHLAAVVFLRLPDEIVAEQRLKRDFQLRFGERAKYYVRMRQRHEADLAAPASDVALRPYEIFYELLRIDFFVRLVVGVAELAAEHAELKRLGEVALARLQERSSPELCSRVLALKDRLLDVDASAEKLAAAADAYEEVYQMIMAMPRK